MLAEQVLRDVGAGAGFEPAHRSAAANDEDGGFSFDDMERCAASLGLILQFDPDACEWRTLKPAWPSKPRPKKKRKRFWLF